VASPLMIVPAIGDREAAGHPPQPNDGEHERNRREEPTGRDRDNRKNEASETDGI
jgi:hypothetical protein